MSESVSRSMRLQVTYRRLARYPCGVDGVANRLIAAVARASRGGRRHLGGVCAGGCSRTCHVRFRERSDQLPDRCLLLADRSKMLRYLAGASVRLARERMFFRRSGLLRSWGGSTPTHPACHWVAEVESNPRAARALGIRVATRTAIECCVSSATTDFDVETRHGGPRQQHRRAARRGSLRPSAGQPVRTLG